VKGIDGMGGKGDGIGAYSEKMEMMQCIIVHYCRKAFQITLYSIDELFL
jgi:hypothetical protein